MQQHVIAAKWARQDARSVGGCSVGSFVRINLGVEELVARYQPWRLGVSFGESEDTDVQGQLSKTCFLPKLTAVRLDWVSFQVMRRTQTSLLKELDVDPRVQASQMGHSVDVNENVYTITSLKRRRDAVNALEKAIWA